MTRALRSELTKLSTLPSTLWTLLIAVVTALGGSVIIAFASATSANGLFDPVTGTFIVWGEYPVLAVGVLGSLAVTTEYAAGQIRTTFTAVPRRSLVLAAKAAAVTPKGAPTTPATATGTARNGAAEVTPLDSAGASTPTGGVAVKKRTPAKPRPARR